VVEHDEDTIRTADWIVDIGPGAGEHGGHIVHSGELKELLENEASITGAYLSGRRSIPLPGVRRPQLPGRDLTVHGAREHNLKNLTVSFPLGQFIAVTGLSGSGKSTLVNDILYAVLANQINGARMVPGRHTRVTGLEHVDKVVGVDQSPIGRTPRSNPATYTGVFDHVRKLFAETTEAKVRGYGPGRFSFNVKGGRCENCAGDGTIKIEMNFLPDVYVPCEVCKGAGTTARPSRCTTRGRTIAEVLDMPIEEAAGFFEAIPAIHRHLKTLVDVGLGYVRLGPAGADPVRWRGAAGQARQRAAEALHRPDRLRARRADHGPALRGHPQAAAGARGPGRQGQHGHRHRAQPRRDQDGRLDHRHGPGGGHKGGLVVAMGTPEEIAETPESYTGEWLRHVLGLRGKATVKRADRSRAARGQGQRRRRPASGQAQSGRAVHRDQGDQRPRRQERHHQRHTRRKATPRSRART
jgi:excinuclease ABC subunit A